MAIPVKFVADFPNVQVGWIAFIGNKPDFRMVKIADILAGKAKAADRRSPEHRHCFVLNLYSQTMGVRQWRGQSKCVRQAMDEVYGVYETRRSQRRGCFPFSKLPAARR